jgi:hypothetical protein
MADYTITISNTVRTFGPKPDVWGVMLWGDKWGEGTADLPVDVIKVISNDITPDLSLFKSITKFYQNTMTVDSETTSETLTDGNGYYYVFSKPTTEAESRDAVSYTSG